MARMPPSRQSRSPRSTAGSESVIRRASRGLRLVLAMEGRQPLLLETSCWLPRARDLPPRPLGQMTRLAGGRSESPSTRGANKMYAQAWASDSDLAWRTAGPPNSSGSTPAFMLEAPGRGPGPPPGRDVTQATRIAP